MAKSNWSLIHCTVQSFHCSLHEDPGLTVLWSRDKNSDLSILEIFLLTRFQFLNGLYLEVGGPNWPWSLFMLCHMDLWRNPCSETWWVIHSGMIHMRRDDLKAVQRIHVDCSVPSGTVDDISHQDTSFLDGFI